MPSKTFEAADYIQPLNMNGLAGRMLYIPSTTKKKREILLIYGHHASLERIAGVAEFLARYGNVTVPDLPGFGGMDSFYKIGQKADLNNMADYLASFIKLRYKNKQITIVGLSLGFMVITKTLQKYPEIARRVNLLISVVGLISKKDFRFNRRTYFALRWGSSLFSHWLTSAFVKHLILRKTLIRLGYALAEGVFIKGEHSKVQNISKEERRSRIDFEVGLWQSNDVRTYMNMGVTMFTLNLAGKHVDLPVYHVLLDGDRYFDSTNVEIHMRQIYKDYIPVKVHAPTHAPSVIAEASEISHYIPPQLRKILNKEPD